MKKLLLIFFSLYSVLSFSQVTGIVVDATNNEPLIGVNVSSKSNSNVGTVTDFDGNFSLDVAENEILVFSYVGYRLMEVPVAGQTNLSVSMEEESEMLDEIVVIGYGAVEKDDLTGVVQKVGQEDFIQGSISSPEKLLNGKVAGLQIKSSGEPGGGTELRFRGGTSLSASSNPLIVIDGVPLDDREVASSRNPFNFVNASDVEDITILKDASAAAIYGSRAANGVIIVTTKSGKEGKLKVDYNGNGNVSIFGGSTNVLSPNNFRNAILAKAPQEFEFLGNESTDWLDVILQNAQSMEHNLAVSGGTKSFNYRVSGGWIKSNGILKTSAHDNKSISLSLNTKLLNDRLNISFKSKTGFTEDRFTPDVVGAALSFDPTRPVYDEDSQYAGYFQWSDPLATNNPLSSLELTNETGKSTRTLNNINIAYDLPFVEGLSAHSNLSYDYIDGSKRNFRDPLLKDSESFERGGYLFNENLNNYTTLIEHYFTYKGEIDKINSSFSITGGHSWQDFDQENRWEEGNGLELLDDGSYNYTTDIIQDSFLVKNRLISFFGRANMTFNDKYLLTASVRQDGSSRFGPENKWGLFPAVAFAWRILEEDFAEGLNNTFSSLKFRLSYGVTGNENIDDFLFKTFYSYGSNDARYQFGEDFISTLRGTGVDPGIKWEETSSLNFGIDFGILNNRLNGSLELYRKNTNDLLYTIAVPGFTNLSDRIVTNIGEIQNTGVELALNAVVYDRKDFGWNIDFNITKNNNKITKLDNSDDPDFLGYEDSDAGISGDVGQTIQVFRVGEPIESFLTYSHKLGENGLPLPDGVDFNGDGIASLLDIYNDINGDGIINENDLQLNKTATPDMMFGFTSNMRYKKFDMAMTIRAHVGNYVYNNVASSSGFFERLTDRETNNIDESAFVVNFNKRQLKSDYYIEDASFLKIDNVSFGYNLDKVSIFRSLRISATFTNLYTLTNYSGLDPELPQFNKGIDNNIYPVARNILLGLRANF